MHVVLQKKIRASFCDLNSMNSTQLRMAMRHGPERIGKLFIFNIIIALL